MSESGYAIVLAVFEFAFFLLVIGSLRRSGLSLTATILLGLFGVAWLYAAYYVISAGVIEATGNSQLWFTIAVAVPVVLGLVAQRFWTEFAAAVRSIPVRLLLGLQIPRSVFGVLFFLTDRLPEWFQIVGGVGDIAAGIGALLAILHLRRNPEKQILAIVEGNIIGILDFAVVLNLGVFVVLATRPVQDIFNMIPLFVVPIFILIHVFALQRLGRLKSLGASAFV